MEKPLYSQVVDGLRQQIRIGELLDRIPPETVLASNFRVSVSTVKRALAILEAEDVVVRIQGKGTFVRSEPKQALQLSGATHGEVSSEVHPETRTEARVGASVTGRTSGGPTLVGVILPMARDGFSRRLLSGVLEGLSAKGMHGMVDFSEGDRERESEIVANFLEAGARGLIVFPVNGEIYNKDLVLLSIERFPLVFVDRWLPGIDVSRVVSQHANGVRDAVNALHAAGHRNMALVSVAAMFPASTESVVERTKGFVEGLKTLGIIPTDGSLWVREVNADDAFQTAEEYLAAMLRQHPEVTALVGVSSSDVPLVLKAARMAGRRVPADLSLVGFDIGVEFSDIGGLFGERAEDFPIAWIDQSEVIIGREAADLVGRLVAGSEKTEVIEVAATFHWGRTCVAVSPSQDLDSGLVEATTSLLHGSLGSRVDGSGDR